jgi:hyperosmotically inducible periplasmic protein
MKRNIEIIFTTTAASLLTLTALSQDSTTTRIGTDTNRREVNRTSGHWSQGDRLHSAAKGSDVIGMQIKNYDGESLGKVDDLALDLESGRIVQVIVSSGGFIGVGDRLTAVPPGALHHDVTNKVLHLKATKEQMKGATEFKNASWTDSFDTNQLSAVATYYGQESGTGFIHHDGTFDRTKPAPTRNTDGTWNKERHGMIPSSRLGHVQRASKLMGMTVKNQQDEKLGKVENILVDVQSGRIVAVVVSSGGFIGMGNELSAVPPTALSFNTDRDTIQLDATRDVLVAAPHFKADQWPDFNEPAYSDSVYRAYRVEPYFRTNAVSTADNTGRNVRDRNNSTLTPLDQGNSRSDVRMTADIRKGITDGKDMSVNARNVKIITNEGMVTLRGPVNSSEEKRLIGEIANSFATVGNVDNQLEVK